MIATILLAAIGGGFLPLVQSQKPKFPGDTWKAIQPNEVENDADFTRFGDAFLGANNENWQGSDLAKKYGRLIDAEASVNLLAMKRLIRHLQSELAASPTFADGNGPLLRGNLEREIGAVFDRLDALELAADATLEDRWEAFRDIVDESFQPDFCPDLEHNGQHFVSNSVFFADRDTQVLLSLDLQSQSGIGGSQPYAYYATLPQAIEFRAVAKRMTAIFGAMRHERLASTAGQLQQISTAWSNYLDHGYSQYPWESWLNGFATDFSWSRPPSSQWVLLHPEPALLFDTRSSRSAEMQTALLLHGLGYVCYFGDTRDWFLGVSATASITSDRSYGLGFGPTLHLGSTRLASFLPNVSVSVLWQDFEVGGTEPVLAATVDLWRLVDRGGEALYEAKLLGR